MISIPNICIPRVNKNIGLVEIRNTFEKILGPKCIRNIEFKHMNYYNNKVFIYFQTIENLYESENLLIDFEESPTNIKHIISKEGKKVLKYEKHTQNRYSQNICPILNEPFNENHEIIELPCKHIFDRDSILFWLENQKSECPVCRFKLPSKEQSYFNNYSNPNQRDPEQRHISNSGSFTGRRKRR